MAPKKANRSPFGIFLAKMKRSDSRFRSKSMPELVTLCAPLYEQLSEVVRKRINELSLLVRNKGLNDYEMNRYLDQLSLDSEDMSPNNINDEWSGSENSANTSRDSGHHSLVNFNVLNTRNVGQLFRDDSDSDFEEDIFNILQKSLETTINLEKKSIVIICFNVLIHTMEDEYYPNEIGLTEFSLEDGLKTSYTNLIANTVPKGYYGKAKEFAEAFHKIPIDANTQQFVKDIPLLFRDIYNFMSNSGLKDSQNRKLVFCKAEDNVGNSDRHQVMGCLKWLDKEMRLMTPNLTKSLINDFVVIESSDLLFLTIKAFRESFHPKPLCIEALTRSIFDFYPYLRCDFHSETENNWCAQAVTKKTAYLFIDMVFSLKLNIDLKCKPSHRPVKSEDNSITYQMLVDPNIRIHRRPHYEDIRYSDDRETEETNIVENMRSLRTGLGRGRPIAD